MSRNQLIDFVERRYGLNHSQSTEIIEQYLNRGFTWLDIVRDLNFKSKIDQYSQLMRLA